MLNRFSSVSHNIVSTVLDLLSILKKFLSVYNFDNIGLIRIEEQEDMGIFVDV